MANHRKPASQRINHTTRDLGPLAPPPVAVTVPEPPGGLLKCSRERWESFWRSTVSQAVDYVSDRPRLERWIRWLDEWERTYRKLRKAELVTTGSMGQQRLNPLARYLALCEDAIQKAEHDLGLSPMARLKLGITLGQARTTLAEFRAGLDAIQEVPPEVWAEWTEGQQPARRPARDEVIDLAQLGD